MTNAAIDENNCLVINQVNFKDFNLHPLWLRERLSEPEFLDQNSFRSPTLGKELNEDLSVINEKSFFAFNNSLIIIFSHFLSALVTKSPGPFKDT